MVLEHRSEARSAEVRAPVFAPAVPALQRRVGEADASDEERPGAALARADAGPRSAAREYHRRVRRRVRERRDRPFSDRAQRAPLAPGGVGLTLLGRRASPQRASASGGEAPEARGAPAKRSGALHFSWRGPKQFWAAGRCTARDGGRSEEGPPARAVLAPAPSSPRAPEPLGGASRPRRPQAPCVLGSRRSLCGKSSRRT